MILRLKLILWAVALIATTRLAFGPGGEFLAVLPLLFWAGFFKGLGLASWEGPLVAFACFIAITAVNAPKILHAGSERPRRTSCANNLQSISKAATYAPERHGGNLPRAIQPGDGDAIPQSWRVTLLRELDHWELFQNYHPDESWDGPHNIKLSREDMLIFCCPSDSTNDRTCSNYRAIIGEHTAWPPDRARPVAEITDGLSRTVILIESASRNTPWSKPEDLTYDEAIELLTNPSPDAAPHYHESTNGFFYKSNAGPSLHVAFADGYVRLLDLPISKEAAKAILTVDGGESYDDEDLELVSSRELDYATCAGLPAFILLVCLPGSRLFRRSRPEFSAQSP
jgi:hypothetical protein